ncbi:MAG: hypothetical protein KDB23_15215 [Planctomycetales bacterium]|nr:hypothetical protein [Planctomycetales bacterium]
MSISILGRVAGFLFVAAAVTVSCPVVQADIFFDVADVQVVPGELARVGVYVWADGGEALLDYDLPIDIGDDGFGFPTGTIGFGAGIVDDQCVGCYPLADVQISGTNQLLNPPFIQNYEAVFSDNDLSSVALTNGPVHLFDLLVQTSLDLSLVGPVPIVVSDDSYLNLLNIVTDTDIFQVEQPGLVLRPGSISAVPEVSAFAAVGMVFGIGVVRRVVFRRDAQRSM